MITVADLIKKTDAFIKANPGKIDYKLSAVRRIKIIGASGKKKIIKKSFLEKYLFIKKHYDDGTFIAPGGTIDPEFRAIYLDFYSIVVGIHVTPAFIDEYFEIMKESKAWGKKWDVHTMHGYVAARLEPYKNLKGQQTYQCSFISKLLHTTNNELPIFDKNVGEVVEGIGNPAGTPKMPYAKRINCGVSTLDDIGDLYKGLDGDPTFESLLGTVKCFSGLKISFEKKCDFIFWVMGDIALKTKKAGKKSGKTSVKGSATGKSAGVKSSVAANTLGNSAGEADSEENMKKETFNMEMEEIYARKVSGTYPYNLLESIFGREAENTEDAQKGAELEKTLSEIIELRLTDEEKTVLFKVYRDGKSLTEIAEEQGADPYETYIHMAASLRKLRHPSSSKLLKCFLKEEEDK